MDENLKRIHTLIYDNFSWSISDFQKEHESHEYEACRFVVNELIIHSRKGKTTPKKAGNFVTFWKRIENAPIEPYQDWDKFDYLVVSVNHQKRVGHFVFPKSILVQKGIVSSQIKEGKRAFRVYPIWDEVKSSQAQKTQKWQLNYFFEINESTDFEKVKKLYLNS